jgi:Fe-S cluster assembly scaffold protein SufB
MQAGSEATTGTTGTTVTTRYGARMDETYPQDLISNVAASTGLPEATASRVVADVAAYYGETVDEFVKRRHAELQGVSNKRNDDIWPQLAAELNGRRFRAEQLSERQLRRIVYG